MQLPKVLMHTKIMVAKEKYEIKFVVNAALEGVFNVPFSLHQNQKVLSEIRLLPIIVELYMFIPITHYFLLNICPIDAMI